MSLKLTIENGIKDAMRAKDADRLRALRAIKSLILLEETSGSSADGRDEAQGLRPEFVHGRQCAPCPDHRMSFRHARGHQRPT